MPVLIVWATLAQQLFARAHLPGGVATPRAEAHNGCGCKLLLLVGEKKHLAILQQLQPTTNYIQS